MSFYDIILADGVTSFPVYALEQDGPGNVSTPRQILRANVSGGAGTNYFEIGGDMTYRFIPGFQFQVIIIDPLASPVTANAGTYTVVAGGSVLNGSSTIIPVNETIPRGFFEIVGVTIGTKTWVISGNQAAEFGVDSKIIVSGNTGGANNVYTIVSAANSGPNTNIVVSETIPGTATADGLLLVNTHFITSFIPGLGGSWTINGEVAARFPVSTSFTVVGTGAGDGDYVVATAVNGIGDTTITVVGTVPVGTTLGPTSGILVGNLPLGHVQYTVPAVDGGVNTSLNLPGPGSPGWGQMLEQNMVRDLEHFNSVVPPAAPIQGQIWYNTGVGLFLFASTPPVDIVGVNSGTNTWTATGDLTSLLSVGDKFVIYGDSGMPFSSLVFQVQTITYNIGPNTTDIVIDTTPSLTPPFTSVANIISPLSNGDGKLYLTVDWHKIPTLDTLSLNDLSDVVITAPVINEVLTYNGTEWVNQPGGGGGSSALSSVTAAVSNATINNGANNITWNWQLTTDEIGFLYGETAPSTGGTGNQVLLETATLANSTASALRAVRGSTIMIETNSDGELTLAGGANTVTPGGAVTIAAGTSTASDGGDVSISGGTAGDGDGGTITLTAGDGVGVDKLGGAVTIAAGDSTGTQNGPDITMTAGGTTGAFSIGGSVFVNGGVATNGGGGNASVSGGNGTNGSGGTVSIVGGDSAGGASYAGGGVSLLAGDGSPTGDGGNIVAIAGNGGSTSGAAGTATLQGGSSAQANGDGGAAIVQGGDATGSGVGGNATIRAGSSPSGTRGNIVQVTDAGYWTQSAGDFAFDDCKSGQYMVRTETTNAVQTELFLDGTGGTRRMVVADDTTWHFDIKLVGRRTDINDEGLVVKIEGGIDRNAGVATTSIIGTVLITTIADDSGGVWVVTVDADTTNGSLRIRVTGEVGKTIRWAAFVRTVEVTG